MLLSTASRWALATFIIMLSLTGIVAIDTYQSDRQAEKNYAIETLARYRASIEKAIYSRFNQVVALEAFVKSNSQDYREDASAFKQQFRYFSGALSTSIPGILSLQLAPDGIVTYITNEQQNAKAIGHDLFKDDARRQQTLRVVNERKIITAGPVDLIQGGTALIVRKAIFTEPRAFDPTRYINAERATPSTPWLSQIPSDFWGFSTVLIDVEMLYNEALKTSDLPAGVRLALRGRHGLGADGDVFWGDPVVFDNPIATTKVLLPGGSWQLGLYSNQLQYGYLYILIGGLLVSLIAAYAMYNRQLGIEIASLSKARTGFLAAMSHELRTPMNGVLGMAELLKDTRLDNQQRQYLEHISSSSKTLLKLINDILDVTKISSERMEIESCEYDSYTVIQHSLLTVQAQAQEKGLALHQSIDKDFPRYCMGDPIRVQQVLVNILGNAVKFTEKGEVSLTARLHSPKSNPMLEITVTDTGIGIPRSQQQRVFEAFTQADERVTRLYGGSGLGMMISKNLVEMMGGNIQLNSALNKGTEIIIQIPYIPALTSNATIDKAIESSPNATPEPSQRPYKILVVEDVDLNREIAIRLLKKIGYEADVAIDGEQALTRIDNEFYDIIFMDRHMPVMDGITATEKIRQRYGSETNPWIIALSASALDEERQQCLNAGMNDYLSKPVSADNMKAKIDLFTQQQQS